MNLLSRYTTAYLNCRDIMRTVYFSKDVVKASDIPRDVALDLIQKEIFENKDSFTKEQIEGYIKNYLGEDYKFDHTSKADCFDHVLDENGNYVYNQPICGCATGPNSFAKYFVTKAIKTGDTLKLSFKVLFPAKANELTSSRHPKYYSDIDLTKEATDLYYTSGTRPEEAEPLTDMHNISKGGKYQMTFKEANGNYVFVSIGVEK